MTFVRNHAEGILACDFFVTVTASFRMLYNERSQRNPEQLVQGSQSSARPLRVQREQLLAESQVLKDEVLAGAKRADDPPEEMSKRHNHGKNCSGKI